jgi:predicted permease
MMWRSKRERERRIERELQAHLELEAEELRTAGMPPEEAALAARRGLGNQALTQEEVRAVWSWTALEQVLQDVRYAWRTLRNHPGFSAAAVLSLALGIGANTAIFSLIDALLLRSLPVRNPGELVQLELVELGRHGNSFGYPTIGALAARTDVFAGLCGFTAATFNLTGTDPAERVPGAWVTGGYYPTLGVEALAGRLLAPDDDRPGRPPVAVLSYDYWASRFGRDFGVVGRTIQIEGQPVQIVGVSQRGFSGANVGDAANLTLPLAALVQLLPERAPQLESGSQWLRVLARPLPGISLAQAKARLAVIWPQMAVIATTPRMNAKRRAVILASTIDLIPGGSGFSYLRSQFRQPLIVLLLVRGTARSKEIALRFAIGAARGRIVRQLLTESLMLSVAGAALGMALAGLASRLLVTLFSNGRRDRILLDLHADSTVLLFTTGIALVTGILFGLAPALRATAAGPGPALKADSGARGRGRSRLLGPVVVLQVALSLVLLIGAGLFAGTLRNLQNVNPGFRHEGVLLVNVDARRAGYQGARLAALYQDLLQRFGRLPGVLSASLSGNTPLSGGIWSEAVTINGQPATESAHFNNVAPRFFEAMGTPLLYGRDFTERDGPNGPAVAIVNQAFVRRYLPEGNPLGRQFSTAGVKGMIEIVGVVGDTVSQSLRQSAPPAVYLPYFQDSAMIAFASYEIRAGGSLTQTAALVREELRRALPRIAAQVQVQGLTEQVEHTLIQERLLAALGTSFGALALILAAVGLYGLLAYTVSRSTGEIGIRMALGAQRGEVLWGVLKGALGLLAWGLALGVPAAWAGSRLISSMLFGLTATDPLVVAGASVVLAATAMAAAFVPARRASRVDPMVALRYE